MNGLTKQLDRNNPHIFIHQYILAINNMRKENSYDVKSIRDDTAPTNKSYVANKSLDK
jgi:hypothetical protein